MPQADISEFLLARIAEDEAAAQASAKVNPPPWRVHLSRMGGDTGLVMGGETPANRYLDGALWDNEGADSLSMGPATAGHIAQWDPARVLAWCAAIRTIVELHRHEAKGPGPVLYDGSRNMNEGVFGCVICSCVGDDPGWHLTYGWCDTVRALASVWADHSEFDPAWAEG